MNALILSDTHGNQARVMEVLRKASAIKLDAVFFLGDGLEDIKGIRSSYTVYSVAGNCDFGSKEKTEDIIDFDGKKILILHGHTRSAKCGPERMEHLGKMLGVDAVLYGHTHERDIHGFDGITIFNPGSLGHPNDGVPSFGTLTVRNGIMFFSHGEL